VQLVLQAAALGQGGEVFVLDMGEPVRIADLAEDLIRLSGLEVGSDIEIVFSGVRPGEKLYEELFFGSDDATPTEHPKILQARDGNPSVEVNRHVTALIEAAKRRETPDELRRMIRQLVPGYRNPSAPVDTTPADSLADLVPVRRPKAGAMIDLMPLGEPLVARTRHFDGKLPA
jgi:FlaA1/EpsC-like NDP-sugar epimerase